MYEAKFRKWPYRTYLA